MLQSSNLQFYKITLKNHSPHGSIGAEGDCLVCGNLVGGYIFFFYNIPIHIFTWVRWEDVHMAVSCVQSFTDLYLIMISCIGWEVKRVFGDIINLNIHISSLKVQLNAKVLGWEQSDMTCLRGTHSQTQQTQSGHKLITHTQQIHC